MWFTPHPAGLWKDLLIWSVADKAADVHSSSHPGSRRKENPGTTSKDNGKNRAETRGTHTTHKLLHTKGMFLKAPVAPADA